MNTYLKDYFYNEKRFIGIIRFTILAYSFLTFMLEFEKVFFTLSQTSVLFFPTWLWIEAKPEGFAGITGRGKGQEQSGWGSTCRIVQPLSRRLPFQHLTSSWSFSVIMFVSSIREFRSLKRVKIGRLRHGIFPLKCKWPKRADISSAITCSSDSFSSRAKKCPELGWRCWSLCAVAKLGRKAENTRGEWPLWGQKVLFSFPPDSQCGQPIGRRGAASRGRERPPAGAVTDDWRLGSLLWRRMMRKELITIWLLFMSGLVIIR